MDTKIQELTDKIYKEGVEKGNEEAERIISEAKAQREAGTQKRSGESYNRRNYFHKCESRCF